MTLDLFFQYLFAGITYGSIYAIVAIGFNIIYNTTGIINFAQGEFVMLGGMISISLLEYMPLGAAIAAAVLITMLVGAAIEMVVIRWLDSPSVLGSPDARILSELADLVVLVAGYGKVTPEKLEKAVGSFPADKVDGVVFNAIP